MTPAPDRERKMLAAVRGYDPDDIEWGGINDTDLPSECLIIIPQETVK